MKYKVFRVRPFSFYEIPKSKGQKLFFFPVSTRHKYVRRELASVIFEFLNLSSQYKEGFINWDDQTHGKLWNYNLQYLDYLKQEDVSIEEKVNYIRDIYSWLKDSKLPLEPYPVSLRIMNMIRFLETNPISREICDELSRYVKTEINYLLKNLEYHILANHLLENAFALWMGANYFGNPSWILKAEQLLRDELKEQILSDGAHYELAPMYHQIILFRVLEAYYLTTAEQPLKSLLKEKAELMLGWMEQMTFDNGTLPHFNDTTEGIGMSATDLLSIAKSIGLSPKKREVKDSRYRILQVGCLKMIADLEGIKPTYQPGHAHADTFSFVLHHGQTPVIVDPGISTYNIGERRQWERSTLAHNTLTIDRKNSSQVWAGFRVGKRAKVKILIDTDLSVEAVHTGYFPQTHKRTFNKETTGIKIIDKVDRVKSIQLVELRFYLHPDISPVITSPKVIRLKEGLMISFVGDCKVDFLDYNYCLGFNNLVPATFILVTINGSEIETCISEVTSESRK